VNKLRICLYGIKGSGLAALAQYLDDYGVFVYGYDKSEELFTEVELKRRNIIYYPFSYFLNQQEHCDILIYSTAYKENLKSIDKSKILMLEYHEILSFMMEGKYVIGVSGTHGKTTTVGMLDYLFNHKFSLIQGDGVGRYISKAPVIMECCEYKDHFLLYKPKLGLILSVELDHTDYFSSYNQYRESFKMFGKNCEKYYCYDLYHFDLANECLIGKKEDSYYHYNITKRGSDGFIINLYLGNKLIRGEKIPFVGEYMIKLYLFCLAVAEHFKMNLNLARKRIKQFKGVKRRFNIVKKSKTIYVDDYAHQPSQIENIYKTITQISPTYLKVLIFKPDRASRLHDFKDEFVKSFLLFDKTYILNHDDDKEKLVQEIIEENPQIKRYNESVGKDSKPCIYCFLSSKKVSNEIKQVMINRGDLSI